MTFQDFTKKLLLLLSSRKFWALVAALATVWTTYFTIPGSISPLQAVQATVAALSAYAIGTGLDDSGKGNTPPAR